MVCEIDQAMNPIQLIFHFIELYAIYLLYTTVKSLKLRLTNLEQKPKEKVLFQTPQPTMKSEKTALGKFNPPTPKTLSPADVRMKEVLPGVYEI